MKIEILADAESVAWPLLPLFGAATVLVTPRRH
jgi:hypothetical protein